MTNTAFDVCSRAQRLIIDAYANSTGNGLFERALARAARDISTSITEGRADAVLQQSTLLDISRYLITHSAPDMAAEALIAASRIARDIDDGMALLDGQILYSICAIERGNYLEAVSTAAVGMRTSETIGRGNGEQRGALSIALAATCMGLHVHARKALKRSLTSSENAPNLYGFVALVRTHLALNDGRVKRYKEALSELRRVADDQMQDAKHFVVEHRNVLVHFSRLRLTIESGDVLTASVEPMLSALEASAAAANSPRSRYALNAAHHLIQTKTASADAFVAGFSITLQNVPLLNRSFMSDYCATVYRLALRRNDDKLAAQVRLVWLRADIDYSYQQMANMCAATTVTTDRRQHDFRASILSTKTAMAELHEATPGHVYRVAEMVKAIVPMTSISQSVQQQLSRAVPILAAGKIAMLGKQMSNLTDNEDGGKLSELWAEHQNEASAALIKRCLYDSDPALVAFADGLLVVRPGAAIDVSTRQARVLYGLLAGLDIAMYPPNGAPSTRAPTALIKNIIVWLENTLASKSDPDGIDENTMKRQVADQVERWVQDATTAAVLAGTVFNPPAPASWTQSKAAKGLSALNNFCA